MSKKTSIKIKVIEDKLKLLNEEEVKANEGIEDLEIRLKNLNDIKMRIQGAKRVLETLLKK